MRRFVVKILILSFIILSAGCSTILPPSSQHMAKRTYAKLRNIRLEASNYAEFVSVANIMEAADNRHSSGNSDEAEELYLLGMLKSEMLLLKLDEEENDEDDDSSVQTTSVSVSAPQVVSVPKDTQPARSEKTVPVVSSVKQEPIRPVKPVATPRNGKYKNYSLEVSIDKRLLTVYAQHTDNMQLPIRQYSVATVSQAIDEYAFGRGRITKIDLNPIWYPTPLTRSKLRKKGKVIPSVVPPGSPLNAMGAFKIHLSHTTKYGSVYRIHGNNDKKRVGKRVTGGCICMDNKEGLELARMIPVGTEVNIIR